MNRSTHHILLSGLATAFAVVATALPATVASAANPDDPGPPASAFESGIPGGGYVPDQVLPTRPAPAGPNAFDSGIPGGVYVPDDVGQPNATPLTTGAPEPTTFGWQIIAVGLGAGLVGLFIGAAAVLATRRRSSPAQV
jgi:hypothetical protein